MNEREEKKDSRTLGEQSKGIIETEHCQEKHGHGGFPRNIAGWRAKNSLLEPFILRAYYYRYGKVYGTTGGASRGFIPGEEFFQVSFHINELLFTRRRHAEQRED